MLRAAAGEPKKQIAQALGLNEEAVGQWRRRWAEAQEGLAALSDPRQRAAIMGVLSDRPRPGCPG